jgi:hypothetical protein
MRLPRMRFTLLRMMVAVAAMAGLFAAISPMVQSERRRLGLRRAALIAIAEQHRVKMGVEQVSEALGGPTTRTFSSRGGTRISQARHDYHRLLWVKYWEAAEDPWLPVAPDPPEPP